MLSNLREFNSYVNHLGNNTHGPPVNKPRFQLNDVQDILEAVGIQPISDIAKCISQYYFHDISNQNLSLLACLFKAITIVRTNDRYIKQLTMSYYYNYFFFLLYRPLILLL
jgi:hypothetical protein